MSGPLQVEFFFSGPPLNADSGTGARTDYAGFNLNGVEYKLGDCAFLYPEDEGVLPYVGRILACFHERSGRAADPHCVEVAWYERRAHLEPDPSGNNWEREVVALEETDVNPIGCISGKAVVLRAGDYEEASRMANVLGADDWLFCRGVYKQSENCVVPFPELAEQMENIDGKRHGKRSQAGVSGHTEGVADSDDVKRQRVAEEQPAVPVRRTGKLVSGRTCVECGATQTPQWREGPAGPKTLCNACGVRFVRAQQRANKRAVTVGGPRAGYGGGGRQSRTSKAAKAEAASARAGRATAAAAVAAAPAEEISQRPLRQAALMAASRTAQYARTGVFPVSATDMELPADSAGDQAVLQQPPPALLQNQQHQQEGRAAGMYGGAGAAAAGRPATPNCSSYDSCGSLQEGVTVEVVVEAVEGDVECCGGRADAAAAGASAARAPQATATAAAPCFAPPLPSPVVAPLLPSAQFGGCSGVMLPTDPSVMTVAPVMAMVGDHLTGAVPQLPPLSAAAAAAVAVFPPVLAPPPSSVAAASAEMLRATSAVVPDAETQLPGMYPIAPGTRCIMASSSQQQQQMLYPQPMIVGCLAPALSGGLGDVSADCGSCVPSGAVEGSVAQVVSAPVSPSVRGDGLGSGDLVNGDGLFGAEDDDLHIRGYGSQMGCGGLDVGLDDDYGPLMEVEVDFGLGPADDGSLFGEFHHGVCMGCVDDDDGDDQLRQAPFLTGAPEQPQQSQPQQTPDCQLGAAIGVVELPAVAARLAPYCPELAPGTDARRLLDCLPKLADPAACDAAATPAAPTTATDACPDSAGPGAEGAAALPGEAVAHLVALGREASRAADEAMAADAALQAVSQVLEAHQEAARKARDAAVANLGRLKDCLSTLAGGDPVAVAEASGHLLELPDLGPVGSLVGFAGGCSCSFDAADLVVAVHS